MHCAFTYDHYFEVLGSVNVVTVKDYDSQQQKIVVLRHDVDFSLEHALKLAELEHKHGIRSTYFILLHSMYYNALSPESADIIKRIAVLSHEIGLHYDTRFNTSTIEKEAHILEVISGQKIISIAPHDTSITPVIAKQHGFIDAFHDIKLEYISDSVQNWRQGCMCNHVGKKDRLHVLTHPIWWSESGISRAQIMDKLRSMLIDRLDQQLKQTGDAHIRYFQKDQYA